MAQEKIETLSPQTGWLEQDPEVLIGSVERCVEQVMRETNVRAEEVLCVGLTNQRETCVCFDGATGQPYHRAILWSDTRTAEVCARVEQKNGAEDQRKKTGLPISTYFTAGKAAWLMENVPSIKEAIGRGQDVRLATVDSWIIWRLTGCFVSEGSNASRTALLNIDTLQWDKDLFRMWNIDGLHVAQVGPSYHASRYGVIRNGPLSGVRVTAALGDQQSALLGQGCVQEGHMKATYGTGTFVLRNNGLKRPHVARESGLLATVALQMGEGEATYAVEGSVACAGSLFNWMKDGMKLFNDFDQLDPMAQSVATGSEGVVVVPAFGGLLAPHWKPQARTCLLGLTASSRPEHIVRAGLEGVAQQTAEVVLAMEKEALGRPLQPDHQMPPLRVDGGLSSSSVLMQCVADAVGCEVWRRRDREATAAGAAIAAGIGAGLWTLKDVPKLAQQTWDVFNSTTTPQQRQQMEKIWHEAVEKSY